MKFQIGQWSIKLVAGDLVKGEFEVRIMGKIGNTNVQIALQNQKENEHNVIDLQIETWEDESNAQKSIK